MAERFDASADLNMQLMQILNMNKDGLATFEIQGCLISLGQPFKSIAELRAALAQLEEQMCARRNFSMTFRQFGHWQITRHGKHLVHRWFAQKEEIASLRAAMNDDASVEAGASASSVDLASNAVLCVAEDELNNWWDEMDVELKAAVFSKWTLGSDDPIARGIPVAAPYVAEHLGLRPRQAAATPVVEEVR
jgi:hypothetical protein